MRADMTEAEFRLWQELRTRRFAGLPFRRQVPLGPYTVDFLCLAARLVIEVDGEQHGHEEGRARDEARDRWLTAEGFRVLRFWNGEVLHELGVVLDTIMAALSEPVPPRPPPGVRKRTPTSPQGGG